MRAMFLSVVLLVSLDKASLFVEHPSMTLRTPVVVGKPNTPTPTGIYLLEKAYSSKLKMRLLVFRRDEGVVYAIHPNLKSRESRLQSAGKGDNYLSAGCIGISEKEFNRLWDIKSTMILQVY